MRMHTQRGTGVSAATRTNHARGPGIQVVRLSKGWVHSGTAAQKGMVAVLLRCCVATAAGPGTGDGRVTAQEPRAEPEGGSRMQSSRCNDVKLRCRGAALTVAAVPLSKQLEGRPLRLAACGKENKRNPVLKDKELRVLGRLAKNCRPKTVLLSEGP
ncbi:uncharacterized protein EI97DRAFT_446420 [Westerdykella ornata]|uniref:Uncharacterized protein n=1 Tax=Westerdykella ornata TaxID=318751 RepID=A0A6A6J6R4_WESOR|nr:uncharacterized protein EI97DRAFT_446420 [Westerdykella ornata]KAF2271668.1 hypothetical protein EI97DRAFT_446420 [Westerdykella ornata]